ncbi:hypothetical protein JW935_28600, partial [candidate division KSB1 bacterium]|nr:hypothetical protein [candidate division KSB1 bacterium]
WITAVFHLSFSYQIPIQFNPGRVLEMHQKHLNSVYLARLLSETDVAGFPLIKIDDKVFRQVDGFFKPEFEKGIHFYQDWVSIVQNLKTDSPASYDYHMYLPVYDGPVFMQGALRGFLGIYFLDTSSRQKGMDYFLPRMDVFQNQLNNAFKEGIQNYVIDGYIDATDDPLLFWKNHLHYLHNWDEIKIESSQSQVSRKSGLWRISNHTVFIPLYPLLQRRMFEWPELGDVQSRYKNKLLILKLPSLLNVDLVKNVSYVRDRIIEIVGLLDAIVEKRRLLVSLENSKKASRRSAVAVVMSRNMSHNIGSHVLAGLSSPERFSNVLPGDIAQFNSYLRTRMDFIADISTAGSSVTMPRRFYQDICNEFKLNQVLLLDNISGTSLRGDRIKLTVIFNGKTMTSRSLAQDPIISLPNDVLGAQAFYVLLENIIRNSSKHAVIQDFLKLSVLVDEPEQQSEKYYRVRIVDNLKTLSGRPDLVSTLNQYIDESIIKQDGTLRLEAWGMMEMKIAAAYLRKIEPEHIDDPAYCPGYNGQNKQMPLLKACDMSSHLGYEFYLLKPHKVLVVVPDSGFPRRDESPAVKYWGVDILSESQLLTFSAKSEHEMMLLIEPSKGIWRILKNNVQIFPFRVLYASDSRTVKGYPRLSLSSVMDALNTEMVPFYAFLWREYIKWLWGNVPDMMNVLSVEKNGNPRVTLYTLTTDGKRRQLVFDLHGDYYKILLSQDPGRIDRLTFYQAYGSASPTGLILSRLAEVDKNKQDWIVCEFMEAAYTTVAVVDERIQYEAFFRRDKYCEAFTLSESLRRMKITLPDLEIDLFRQQFTDKDRIKIETWIDRQIKEKRVHFMIIHLGVIEKLVGTGREEIKLWIETRLKNAPATRLIITSGRGVPANLPHVLFLPYSLLARYTLDQTSKYHLTKVLFSARGLALEG